VTTPTSDASISLFRFRRYRYRYIVSISIYLIDSYRIDRLKIHTDIFDILPFVNVNSRSITFAIIIIIIIIIIHEFHRDASLETKLQGRYQLVGKSVRMTLNGVVAVALRYFT